VTGSVREHALSVVTGCALADKLRSAPSDLDDMDRGPVLRLEAPGRPDDLAPQPASVVKAPPLQGMADPAQRLRILHAFANHELQAVELFAWALLAFPDAPDEFRAGLLSTLSDEQRHLSLYLNRLEQLGVSFGRWPVSGYFWNKREHFSTPLRFVCSMCLTFESANLDHTLDFALAAERVGDDETAAILRQVHVEERAHVAFGMRWLAAFKQPTETLLQAWLGALAWPLRPALARGREFHAGARKGLGFDEEWLALLADARRS